MQAAEEATGKTAAELYKMMEQGQLLAKDFLVPFATAMRRIVRENSALQKATEKLTSQQNRMNTAYKELINDVFQKGGANFFGSVFKTIAMVIEDLSPLLSGAFSSLFKVGGVIVDLAASVYDLAKALLTLGEDFGVLDGVSHFFRGINYAINQTLANIYELIAVLYDVSSFFKGDSKPLVTGLDNLFGRVSGAIQQDWDRLTGSGGTSTTVNGGVNITVDGAGKDAGSIADEVYGRFVNNIAGF